jgi:Rab family protein
MITNFVSGNVAPSTKGPTLGIEYSSKTISVDASHTVKAQIWDTAGQEQYRSVITR